ncbi:hypothetical protein ACFWWC_30875 [Streptomyces sp. NPDC058642]|uniref:hypothetical protein n=1 Tax=Streptomyces sp. NPDC058642 TaxID=3346572 RepID=UPI00364A336F
MAGRRCDTCRAGTALSRTAYTGSWAGGGRVRVALAESGVVREGDRDVRSASPRRRSRRKLLGRLSDPDPGFAIVTP